MKKIKLLLKMIRNIIHSVLLFVVNSFLAIYTNIHRIFSFCQKKVWNPFISFFKESNSIIKESMVALLISAVGGLFAGIILGNMSYYLTTFPGLMVLIPGAIAMRGNIFGALGSRLGSNLHIGTLSPQFKKSDILIDNLISSLILTLILSVFLAIIAKIVCVLLNFQSISLVEFTLISVFSGIISSIIILPLTMFISLKSFENGWDPDNITTPLIATFGDLFTLPSIILSIMLLSLFPNTILKDIVFIFLIIVTILGFYYGITNSSDLKKIIKQSTPVLFICSVLGISAGAFLNNSISTLLKNPCILILVPLFSGQSGNLISILGARLSSSIHAGIIHHDLNLEKSTVRNFIIILILAIIIYPLIGILAESATIIFGKEGLGFISVILISTISGMILISIMLFIVFFISSLSYNKGLDPDNIVIPISTSVTDSIASLILVSMSLIFLNFIVF